LSSGAFCGSGGRHDYWFWMKIMYNDKGKYVYAMSKYSVLFHELSLVLKANFQANEHDTV